MCIKKYMESPMHQAAVMLAKIAGIPDSCIVEIACCDCGKKDIAANFTWRVDRNTFAVTGPHCGCKPV